MDDKEHLCFATGCQEFRVFNPVRRNVKVTRIDAPVRRYGPGERIPVALLDAEAEVDRLFEWPE